MSEFDGVFEAPNKAECSYVNREDIRRWVERACEIDSDWWVDAKAWFDASKSGDTSQLPENYAMIEKLGPGRLGSTESAF